MLILTRETFITQSGVSLSMKRGWSNIWDIPQERMDSENKRALQNRKLREKARLYNKAPIIRDLWDDAGIDPEDINTVDDLVDVPIFRKDDVRKYTSKGDEFGGRLMNSIEELGAEGSVIATSSGTTGTPTNLLYTDSDMDTAAEWGARHLWSAGLRPGDTYANVMPNRDVIVETFPRGAHLVGATVTRVEHTPAEVDRLIHVCEHLEPSVVDLLSGPLIDAVNDYCEENGRDPKNVMEGVDSFIFGGAPLIEEYRREVEENWGIELYETAGSLEPRWTCVECEVHDGFLHVPDDHFYFEVVDPETGNRVDEGERGELVVTALSYDGMAHIRWGSDDIVEMKRGTCECGRTSAQVNFRGRLDDLIRIEGRSILPTDVLPVVHQFEEMPGNYFQFWKDSVDELKIRIAYDEEEVTGLEALKSNIQQNIEEELEVPIRIVEAITEEEIRQLGPDHKVPYVVEE
jgi:phenylacetate-CoA ligase